MIECIQWNIVVTIVMLYGKKRKIRGGGGYHYVWRLRFQVAVF
jgi:hypothetical protein